MVRICNLNSLSSVLDRLVIEYLKLLKFIDERIDVLKKEEDSKEIPLGEDARWMDWGEENALS